MPVSRAQIHAQTHFGGVATAPYLEDGSTQGHHAAQQVDAMQAGYQVEEAVGWIRIDVVSQRHELPPRFELTGHEDEGQ